MGHITSCLTEDLQEIENVFLMLAEYTRNKISGEDIFKEISCIQYGVLLFLAQNENVTVHDLVKSQNLPYPTCSQLLDELTKLDLVNRKRSEEDRRLVFVNIKNKGRNLIQDIHKRRQEVLKRIFEGFEPNQMKVIMESFSLLKNKLFDLKDLK